MVLAIRIRWSNMTSGAKLRAWSHVRSHHGRR